MKTPLSLFRFSLCVGLAASHALLGAVYEWTPDGTQEGAASGGNGVWSSTGVNWWSSSAMNASAFGTSANPLGGAGSDTFSFMGGGTLTKSDTSYFGDGNYNQTLFFAADSRYTILGQAGSAGLLDGRHSRLLFNLAPSALLTLGGDGNWIGVSSSYDNGGTATANAGLTIGSGGAMVLKAGAWLRNNSDNTRLAIKNGSKITFGAGSLYAGVGKDLGSIGSAFSGLSRIAIDGGTLEVDGGVVHAGYSELANEWRRGFGIVIGMLTAASDPNDSVFTLTSGTVVALGDARGNDANYAGLLFAGNNATYKGGVANLNGGTLVTTNIRTRNDVRAELNLDGVTIVVSTAAAGTTVVPTQAQLRTRLDNFITGFNTTATNRISLGAGGVVFDTSQLDTVALGGDYATSIISVMGGTGGLAKTGGNTLALRAVNTYTGATVVEGGALRLQTAGAINASSAVTVGASGTINTWGLNQTLQNLGGSGLIVMGAGSLVVASTADTEFSGAITSNVTTAGAITKSGGATFTLAAPSNSYYGATIINAGTLRAGATDVLAGSSTLSIANGAVFDANGRDQSFKNLTGSGSLTLGAATLTVSNSTADNVYSGVISGAGGLAKTGDGVLALDGVGTYTGTTTVNGGLLRLQAAGAIDASGAVNLGASGTIQLWGQPHTLQNLGGSGLIVMASGELTVASSMDTTFGGAITSSSTTGGLFTKTGSATFTLASAAEHWGATTVAEGTLRAEAENILANSRALAIGAGAVFDANNHNQMLKGLTGSGTLLLGTGTLTLNDTAENTYDGLISGSGDLVKSGTGALALGSASADFTGLTTVNAGALLLANGLANSALALKTSTTLGAAGALAALTAEAGSTIIIGARSGTSAQTLTVNGAASLTGATLTYDLFADNASDRLDLTGALTNGGNNTIDLTTYEIGAFNLGAGLAALGADATTAILIEGAMIVPGGRQQASFDTTETGYLKLITESGESGIRTWTGANGAAINSSAENWNEDDQRFARGDTLVFDGSTDAANAANRVIAVQAAGMTVSGMEVSGTADYTFNGGRIVADKTSAVGTAIAAPTGKLTKTGAGALTLDNGANDFRDGVDFGGGILALGDYTTLGGGPLLVTDTDTTLRTAGTLGFRLENSAGIAPDATLVLDVPDASATATLAGGISGSGVLSKTGAGALALTGSNAHAGGTRLAAGTLALAHDHALGAGALVLEADAATVRFDADALAVGNAIAMGAHAVTFDTGTHAAALSGALSGDAGGVFTKTGGGTLTLSGSSTAFHSALTIAEGMLAFTSADSIGTSATAAATIAAGATFAINQAAAGDMIFARRLDGSGTLDITLSSGTGRIGFAQTAAGGAWSGNIALHRGTLAVDENAYALLGASSSGTLAIRSGGLADVTATGTLRALALDGGTVRVTLGADNTTPLTVTNLAVTAGGAIAANLDGPDIPNPIVNPPASPDSANLFDLGLSTGIKLIAAENVTGVGEVLAVTRLDGAAITSPLFVDVTQNGAKAATATYNYNATAMADGMHLSYGITALDILSGQSLVLDNAGAASSTLAAGLGGAGGIDVRASGTITLSGSIGFTGATTVSRGALKLIHADALANSASVTLAENTTLDAGGQNQTLRNLSGAAGSAIDLGAAGSLTLDSDEGVDTVFAGNINATAAATLTKTGSGALTLGGSSTHGDTVISGGTLRASRLDALGSGEVTIAAGTTLELNGASGNLDRAVNTGGTRRGTLAFVDSAINLDRAYANIAAFAISGRSYVRVNAAGAFGGGSGSVSVRDGGALEIGAVSVAVAGLAMDGGALLFSSASSALTSASGTVSFANHASVGLADGSIASGRYTFVSARSLLSDNASNIPDYAPYQHGKRVVVSRAGQSLVFDVMDTAAHPAKDAAMVFDTVLASLGTIYGHMSESLADPLISRQSGDPVCGFWARGFGSSADYEQTAAQPGFKDWSYGVAVGCDRVFGERLLLGLWGGFATSALDTFNGAATDADHQLGGVYAALKLGRVHLAADVAFGLLQTQITRDEQTGRAYGGYDGDYFAAGGEIGFRLFEWAGGSLSPTAALHCIEVRFDDYEESGPGAMRVSGFNQDRVLSVLGMKVAHGFTLPWNRPASLDARLGWQQTLRGNTGSVDMAFASDPLNSFAVTTGGYSSGSLVLGLGLRAAFTDSLGLGLGYDYESASGRQRHSLNGTLRYAW